MERSRLPNKRSENLSADSETFENTFYVGAQLRPQHHAGLHFESSPINTPYGSIETFPCSTADVLVASKLLADLKPLLCAPRFTVCGEFDIFSATTTA